MLPNKTLPCLLISAAFLSISPLKAQEKTMLILDGSGSMWGQIDGRAKITIAQDTIGAILPDLSQNRDLGLMVYGHREKGQCKDIEILIEPGAGNADQIADAVSKIKPKGKTPMTDAITQAAEAMRHEEDKASVILISDGIETCAPDPCAAARALNESGVDFTAHVIGFDIDDPKADQQLACIAQETGGQYLKAEDAKSLTDAMSKVAAVEPDLTPEPQADIEIIAARQTKIGAVLSVAWLGLDLDKGGPYELIVGNDELRKINGTVLTHKNPDDLEMPAEPGDYQISIQTISGQKILASTPVTVFAAPVSLTVPDEILAGSTIEVHWTGPGYRTDWITVGLPGEWPMEKTMLDNKPSPALLDIPTQAGQYVITYQLSQDQEILTMVPVTVTMPTATINAPQTAKVGETITLDYDGPNNKNDFIGLVAKGFDGRPKGRHTNWLNRNGPVKLIMPDEPGNYDIHYYLSGENVRIGSTDITVTE